MDSSDGEPGAPSSHPPWAKSWAPSVKARVVRMKQQFRKSKEGHFYSIYISFAQILLIFFLSLSSISPCFVIFLIYFTRTYFLLKFGFFWLEGAGIGGPETKFAGVEFPKAIRSRPGGIACSTVGETCRMRQERENILRQDVKNKEN